MELRMSSFKERKPPCNLLKPDYTTEAAGTMYLGRLKLLSE